MDDDCSGDSFGGFIQKHSSAVSSISASVNNAPAFESARRSRNITFHHGNTGTADVETNVPQKKRVSRVTGGGLRQFSSIVCNMVERRGRTTYKEVADDVISEFSGNDSQTATLSEFDEKNVRRRVYDALNVLEALDIITRDRKEINWKGLQDRNIMDSEEMKAACVKLMNRIGRKMAYLKDLEEQTSTDATVEIEISEDMHLVHFDFNSTPFFLHDDAYILKLLQCHQRPESINVSQSSSADSSQQSVLHLKAPDPFIRTLR